MKRNYNIRELTNGKNGVLIRGNPALSRGVEFYSLSEIKNISGKNAVSFGVVADFNDNEISKVVYVYSQNSFSQIGLDTMTMTSHQGVTVTVAKSIFGPNVGRIVASVPSYSVNISSANLMSSGSDTVYELFSDKVAGSSTISLDNLDQDMGRIFILEPYVNSTSSGNFDGNEYADYAFSNSESYGKVDVFLGLQNMPFHNSNKFLNGSNGFSFYNSLNEKGFGAQVIFCDITGDQRDELMISSPYSNKVYVLKPDKDLPKFFDIQSAIENKSAFYFEGIWGGLGSSLACGDVNSDGRKDLSMTTPEYTDGVGYGFGGVVVYYGKNNFNQSRYDLTIKDNSKFAFLIGNKDFPIGSSVTAGHDINKDGNNDLCVGARGQKNQNEGAIFCVFGNPYLATGKISIFIDDLRNGFVLNSGESCNLGHSVKLVEDMNDDKIADLAVGCGNNGAFVFGFDRKIAPSASPQPVPSPSPVLIINSVDQDIYDYIFIGFIACGTLLITCLQEAILQNIQNLLGEIQFGEGYDPLHADLDV